MLPAPREGLEAHMTWRERLRLVTDRLLDDSAPPIDHLEAARDLAALFACLAPVDGAEAEASTVLPTGKALGPADAARCIEDHERTRTFLMGVESAVRGAIERRGHAHVLYAGTGPFAPLLVPLTTRYGADELSATLLDVHRSSVDRLRLVVDAVEAGDHVTAIHCVDATAFDPPAYPPTDVLIVETMQRALTREPQVAIVRHLASSLADDAVMVPERITVTAALDRPGGHAMRSVGEASAPDEARIELGEVFVLDLDGARRLDGSPSIECSSLTVPDVAPSGRVLTLDTVITVAPGIQLGANASGITMPHHLFDVAVDRPGTVIALRYEIGPDPGFVADVGR